MTKARSRKTAGLLDDAINWFDSTVDSVKKAVTPEEGSPADKVINRKKYQDKAIAEGTAKPKPKKQKHPTGQTKNETMARDEKRAKNLTPAQAEEIRKRLQKGETVATEEYAK